MVIIANENMKIAILSTRVSDYQRDRLLKNVACLLLGIMLMRILFRMFRNFKHRHQVIEDQPFVHKQLVAKLAVPFPKSAVTHVTLNGTTYRVTLDWVNKGKGHALMFRCPITRRMVERLYPWAGMLVSRQVIGLHYASQVRGRLDVMDAKADRLRFSLKDPLYVIPLVDAPIPRKPFKMRWSVYWRKVEKLEQLQREMSAICPIC